MKSNLRFAIIGCGKIASRHASQIIQHGNLVAVCDILKEKSDELAGLFSANAYYTAEDLLQNEKKLDVVVICTPNGLHAEHSIQALNAGCNVLCEKPMSIRSEDGRRMIAAANAANKKLYIVKQNRYNPPVVFVKNLLEQNKLGKILSFEMNCFWNRPKQYYLDSWHGTLAMDGGILFTQFSHFIDLLYWLLGDIKTVTGKRFNYQHKDCIEFEDAGVASLTMENNATGIINYDINTEKKNIEGSLKLIGEKGMIKIGGQYLNVLEDFFLPGEKYPELPEGNSANQYGSYQGSMSNHDKVYENLIKALADPAHPFIDAAEALKSVEIIEKIYKASPLLT